LTAVLLFAACTGGQPGMTVEAEGSGPAELGSTLNVRVEGDSVHLELHVTNVTAQPLQLEFGSAQQFDFTVAGAGVEWRWSDDMSFAQVVTQQELAAGASLRFAAVWHAEGRRGEYVATAQLASFNYPVELSTPFMLPAE
jgi:hypothetical protein